MDWDAGDVNWVPGSAAGFLCNVGHITGSLFASASQLWNGGNTVSFLLAFASLISLDCKLTGAGAVSNYVWEQNLVLWGPEIGLGFLDAAVI